MAQRRVLILDDAALVMVVDKDVVKQVDENRGEMNRTEFVNFLIHRQLEEFSASRNYIEKEEFHRFVQEVKGILRNFFDFFLSLELGKQVQGNGFEEWCDKLQALDSAGETQALDTTGETDEEI